MTYFEETGALLTKIFPSADLIVFLSAAGVHEILISGKNKLLIRRFRCAGIGRNEFSVLRLVRVLYVIDSRFHALCNRFPLVDMHGNNTCCCHVPLHKKKSSDL